MNAPILFRPRFIGSFMPVSDDPRIAPLKESWLKAFPHATENATIDFEDWVENAVRLHTALMLEPNRVALVGEDHQVVDLAGQSVAPCENALFLGAWHREDDEARGHGVFKDFPYPAAFRGESHLALHYAKSDAVRQRVGREFWLCGLRESPEDPVELDIYDCLAGMYQRGLREVFIKVNRAKYAIFKFQLESGTPGAIRTALIKQHEDFAWTTVHLGGQPDAFLVQEVIPMRYEYRVVVVKHGAVAGAGCVEKHTPLNNTALWDPKMERERNRSTVTDQTCLVREYRMFALQFTQAYQAERPGNGNYILDLAISNGQIVVIELNPMQNYGLYAMDVEAILAAQLYR